MSFIERFINTVNSYKRVFKKNDKDVEKILIDLGRFCPVDPTTKLTRPYRDNEVFIMIGRRQVLSYILGKINMTTEELNLLIKKEEIKKQQQQIM